MAIKSKILAGISTILSSSLASAHGTEFYHEILEQPLRAGAAVLVVAIIVFAMFLITRKRKK